LNFQEEDNLFTKDTTAEFIEVVPPVSFVCSFHCRLSTCDVMLLLCQLKTVSYNDLSDNTLFRMSNSNKKQPDLT